MPEPAPTPEVMQAAEPHRSWRFKWRFVALYWVAQALVLHVLAVTFLGADSIPNFHRGVIVDALTDLGAVAMTGVFIAIITACQAVLLLPVRRPVEVRHGPGIRLLHSVIAGLAVGGLVLAASWPIFGLADTAGLADSLDFLWRSPMVWLIPVTAGLATSVCLWASTRAGIPVKLSVVIAAAAAAVLLTGLVGALWSIPRLIVGDADRFERAQFGSMCGVVLVGWVVATPLVYSFIRRRGAEDGLARVSSRLFLGTILEAAAVIPLDVMVRRKSNCYCGEGTFWTLAACWAVGAFALGPVIFLVPLSKRRKRWYAGLCEACGYDMKGCMNAERCPECGAGWRKSHHGEH